jgi:hypothetical protein
LGTVNQPNEIAETRMSRFGVDLFFYFCIGMGQWLLQVIIMERLVDPFRNFMDLCSVANISVLAMTNPLVNFGLIGINLEYFREDFTFMDDRCMDLRTRICSK